MKYYNNNVLLFFFYCWFFVSLSVSAQQTPITPNPPPSIQIQESYKQKIEEFVKQPRNFAFLTYIINQRMELIQQKGQKFTNAFKLAVIEKAKEDYISKTATFYIQAFGPAFAEKEFDSVATFLNTNEGLQYAASIVEVILKKQPIMVKIPQAQLKRIDTYLATTYGEKLKIIYPAILQHLQQGLLAYIDKWIESTNQDFNNKGQSQFKTSSNLDEKNTNG